jgi:uncharacterized membrane protein YgcG
VRKREIFALVMVVAAFALTPFAYGASVAFGVVAFAIGIAGLVLFTTARPWRSRSVEPDQYVEPRKVSLGLAMHDLERALTTSAHDAGHGGGFDGGGHSSDGGGGSGGDGGGSH